MNKNKITIIIILAIMTIVSISVAWIMTKNYQKDDSKLRYKLTRLYKEYKKADYSYDEKRASNLYKDLCSRCHNLDGTGSATAPALTKSAHVIGDFKKPLKVILHGMKGKIERNGREYNSLMPSFKKIDPIDLTHVLNYIRTNFENNESYVPTVEVIKMRIDTLSRNKPYTELEL